MKFPEGWDRGLRKIPSVGEVWICFFFELHILGDDLLFEVFQELYLQKALHFSKQMPLNKYSGILLPVCQNRYLVSV